MTSSKIPPGADPTEWFIQQVRHKHVPNTIGRMTVALLIAALVKHRVIRSAMVLSVVLDLGFLAWMRTLVRRQVALGAADARAAAAPSSAPTASRSARS
ncbi:MAG TPA: hypothetical protein PLS95_19540 [Thermoanaerobaculales bacterium]|nr:hypothetical protein [Thermoanaerobaculales bacterium]